MNQHGADTVSTRTLVTSEEWQQIFSNFKHSHFRLEALPEYSSPKETSIIKAYLRGENPPLAETDLASYVSDLKRFVESGKIVERVHVVPEELTPYLRWEIFWMYKQFVDVGVKVFLLEESKHPEIAKAAFEYYLIDEKDLIYVEYDDKGAFRELYRESHPTLITDAADLRVRIIGAATPFHEYTERVKP